LLKGAHLASRVFGQPLPSGHRPPVWVDSA
jgi:hypothetical protein